MLSGTLPLLCLVHFKMNSWKRLWNEVEESKRILTYSVVKMNENVDSQTHTKVPVPVSLTEVKRVMVEVVLGRVTTREYSMLSTFLFFFSFSLFVFFSSFPSIPEFKVTIQFLHPLSFSLWFFCSALSETLQINQSYSLQRRLLLILQFFFKVLNSLKLNRTEIRKKKERKERKGKERKGKEGDHFDSSLIFSFHFFLLSNLIRILKIYRF